MVGEQERERLHQSSLPLRSVNRALLLYATLLGGIFGLHKWLLGAYREAWVYIALSWTGVSALASVFDFLDLLRQPAMGNGFFRRRLIKRHVADAGVIEKATWKQLARAAFVFFALIAFAAWNLRGLHGAHEEVSRLCATIPIGQSAQTTQVWAKQRGFQSRPLQEGSNALIAPHTFGRHQCAVDIVQGQVSHVRYVFFD
jgi:hypothetical protein